ncbi:uncharacterized protein LOC108836046 [Raphanus sativus]|uniref:Uncharacterized protein LOC108836046 n=1 Tax=Raphanus sativus TaxID=3726 RepID=A0A6J0LXH6_RAPSA|nr:uncharacterized protein LOC108836046 [Raphanus sativus]
MDKALMAMSLDDDDEPFDMPNLPQFSSCERNTRSLIGRLLNPDCQKIANLLREMPRKWQKQGKVRGIALSKERFQFLFDNEHDLVEVLEKGVHTSNEWALAIERWVENPPPDYLQFINVWVQVRNIPLNHYTEEAITALRERLGMVKVVAFDPDKPQLQEYVRMQIRMNVARPFKQAMVVNLPEGGTSRVYFNYERLQKRCHECQRLNHAKDICPRLVKQRKDAALERRQRILREKQQADLVLRPHDPLFGVLTEDQVGLCPITGRSKISSEVLEEMRRYMMMATDSDKAIRIERIRSSVAEVEKDPMLQKTILRLEPAPVFTKQVDKGKGRLFDLDLNTPAESNALDRREGGKLMASAIKASRGNIASPWSFSSSGQDISSKEKSPPLMIAPPSGASMLRGHHGSRSASSHFQGNPTEHGLNLTISQPSGVFKKTTKPRRRPYVSKRKASKTSTAGILQELYGSSGSGAMIGAKRKGSSEEPESYEGARKKEARVIPHEGSPKIR